MRKHYLIIGYRSLLRERLHAIINTAGLGLGMACALLTCLFIAHGWSYDRLHAHADTIFRPAIAIPAGALRFD